MTAAAEAAWSVAADWVIAAEGGYVCDPCDRGGETHYGITWPTLRRAAHDAVVPLGTTIRSLTSAQALAIYRDAFWLPLHCDQMQPALALAVFDAAVHSGPRNSARWLQEALRAQGEAVAADGIVGQATLTAASRQPVGPLLHELLQARREVLAREVELHPTQRRFERGWENRLRALEEQCRLLLA